MNPFTQHTQQQGLSYSEHAGFALGIAWRLLHTVIIFSLHGLFPFIKIAPQLDLEATAEFINQRNHWLEGDERRRENATEGLTLNLQ